MSRLPKKDKSLRLDENEIIIILPSGNNSSNELTTQERQKSLRLDENKIIIILPSDNNSSNELTTQERQKFKVR